MGRDRSEHQTLDLFSTGGVGGPAPDVTTSRPPRRPILPRDLPKAIKYLDDRELDRLLRAAIEEARRRGRLPPSLDARQTKTERGRATLKERPSRSGRVVPAAASLTQGQVNAVRAAFKAGIAPSRIARHFGLKQSDVRQALASDELKR